MIEILDLRQAKDGVYIPTIVVVDVNDKEDFFTPVLEGRNYDFISFDYKVIQTFMNMADCKKKAFCELRQEPQGGWM